jgi:hypothetical protein
LCICRSASAIVSFDKCDITYDLVTRGEAENILKCKDLFMGFELTFNLFCFIGKPIELFRGQFPFKREIQFTILTGYLQGLVKDVKL